MSLDNETLDWLDSMCKQFRAELFLIITAPEGQEAAVMTGWSGVDTKGKTYMVNIVRVDRNEFLETDNAG